MDGIKETHDTYRHSKVGMPTFDRIYQTTKLFDIYEVDYNILTVVNQNVAEHIEEIYTLRLVSSAIYCLSRSIE